MLDDVMAGFRFSIGVMVKTGSRKYHASGDENERTAYASLIFPLSHAPRFYRDEVGLEPCVFCFARLSRPKKATSTPKTAGQDLTLKPPRSRKLPTEGEGRAGKELLGLNYRRV